MNNIQALHATVAVLTCGYPLVLWVSSWRLRTQRAELRKQAEAVFAKGHQILSEECATLKIEVERARAEAGEERGKRERYFRKISEIEQERTTWQELYHSQVIGHGNAQELMMSTIENLARQVQSLGQRPRVPTILHTLREEYRTVHEMPVIAAQEAAAAIEAAKALTQQPQPTAETYPVTTEA